MNLKSKQEKIVSVCVIIGIFAASALVCRPVFYLNDDVTMRGILSGSYTGNPDGHTVYMKYPLTWLLSLLYKAAKAIPWLELFFAGCLMSSVYACVSKIRKKGMIVLLPAAVLFMLPFFWYMHYTMIAAVLAGTAAICLCSGDDIRSVVFWLFAWMIRSQVAYLALPFLAVALLWRFAGIKKESAEEIFVRSGKVCVTLIVGLLLCMGINSLAYKDADWQEYLEYNEVRTQLYDYTNFHSTDAYSLNYEQYGMTAEEFLVLDSYNTMLDSAIDAELIGTVADKITGEMENSRELAERLKECVLKYYYEMRYSDHLYVIVWAAVLLGLISMLLLGRDFWGIALVFCLEAGRSLIWIYLIYRGRFPERVVVSLYVIEILLLAGMLAHLPAPCKERLSGLKKKMAERFAGIDVAKKVFRAAFVVGLCLIFLLQMGADMKRANAQAQVQEEWSTLKQYCEENPRELYLIDVFSMVEYGGLQYQPDTANMMLAGGWMSASPLALQRFEKIGVSDGAQALYESDSVFFVSEKEADLDWLKSYMNHRFGQCELYPVDEIECSENKVFSVYAVKR